MIPLMKNAFSSERATKQALVDFILNADKLSMGVKCQEFEEEFCRYQGSKYAVLFNSGASANLALIQTMLNLGKLKVGDKVAFSALTWPTNVMPLIQLGLTPIPVDCSPSCLNVMVGDFEKTLSQTKDIKALFITNAMGFAGNLDKICAICSEKGIFLLEDNCEALGSEIFGRKTGTFGLASSSSFFVAHHLSTIEGGMVCSDDDEIAEMLIIVRANGWDRNLSAEQQHRWRSKFHILSEFDAKYTFYDLAFNLRPTEITGFIGHYQLQFLEDTVNIRERNFLKLSKVSATNDDLIPFEVSHLNVISSFAYPVLCKTPELREFYIRQFAGAGIEIRPMIAGNIGKQPFFKKYSKKSFILEGTDIIENNGFYCGNYPDLNNIDLELISSCLIKN